MIMWDYDIPETWRPSTTEEWEWYLVRKINYGDIQGLTRSSIQKHFKHIQDKLDQGKRILFQYYLKGK